MSATRRRSMTAGTLPCAATQTKCAQPVCSATLTTHGAGLMSSPGPLDAMRQARRDSNQQSGCFVLADLLPAGPLVDLVIMDLAFLAPRCHRHAYAFASAGAAGGTVPTFFIGIDHVAQFAMDHPDAGDQRTDIAVNIDPELHHVGVPVAPVGGGRQLREVHSDVQVGGGMAVIQEALARALRIAILRNIEERHVE